MGGGGEEEGNCTSATNTHELSPWEFWLRFTWASGGIAAGRAHKWARRGFLIVLPGTVSTRDFSSQNERDDRMRNRGSPWDTTRMHCSGRKNI